MKLACIVLFGLLTAGAQMTSRDYFREMKVAGQFKAYGDEYACFDDDAGADFKTMARVSDIIAHATKDGNEDTVARMKGHETELVMRSYYKGVASELEIYKPTDETGTSFLYQTTFPPNPSKRQKIVIMKVSYVFNWATGRYRFTMSVGGRPDVVPPKSGFGKCELIAPVQ